MILISSVNQASEDIGLANPDALPQAVAAYQATLLMGMPECDVRSSCFRRVLLWADAELSLSAFLLRSSSCSPSHRRAFGCTRR